ncbi:UDP-glucuronic acid decarboxylase 2 [Linum perenne]
MASSDTDLISTTASHLRRRPPSSSRHALRYLLGEQRLACFLSGFTIAALFFHTFTISTTTTVLTTPPSDTGLDRVIPDPTESVNRRVLIESGIISSGIGKVPQGLKRKGNRILVTGGAGFVGSHLVDRLIGRGDSVIVIDNFFTGRKENLMHHFAHKTNVAGTLNMLGLAKRVGARFLLTSTSEVYGDPLQHPQSETYWGNVNPIGVRSCYDEGKRTAETLTMDYHRGAGIEVRIARIFNTYGPRMCIDDGRVVSNFVAQALRKEPMTVYGDGKQTRSFQYVSDLVEGLVRLMEGDHIGPFNLGNPGEFTMLQLAEVVQETIDPKARIEFRPNTEDDPHKRKPDITRAKELLGWEPTVSLRKGLPMMVSDFQQRIYGEQKALSA